MELIEENRIVYIEVRVSTLTRFQCRRQQVRLCLIPLRLGPAETGFVKCFYSGDGVPWRPKSLVRIARKQLANARRHKKACTC